MEGELKMEKKRQLVVICDVKHMFKSSLLVFFILGAAATIAFYYVNIDMDEQISTTAIIPIAASSTSSAAANIYNNSVQDAGCDLFSGKWVYDVNYSYPLYTELQCPYITPDFACGQYGRLDSMYQHWRWQPHSCTLPRFDAKEVLERLRGKRVLFVGDSVNRNQWVSMVCMLQRVIPLEGKLMERNPDQLSLISFKAAEYNVSVDFYWAPLLVESNADHPTVHKTNERLIDVESIEKHAKNWINADVLVFNSYLWWRRRAFKILHGSLEDSNQYNVVDSHQAYDMVLKIWSMWLQNYVNHTRTQTYFMSMTATHQSGKEWGMTGDESCLNETMPVAKKGFWESGSDSEMMRILEFRLRKLKEEGVNVQVVNITQLTQYRKDAHPSIHRLFNYPLTTTQLNKPSSYADCTHWCLPGVPDVWNELLLVHILRGNK